MQPNGLPDNYEFMDPSMLNPEFPFYFPPIEAFSEMPPPDFFNYSEFDGIEPSQMCQMFDQAFQNYTKEFIKYIPNPLDGSFPYESVKIAENPKIPYANITKIGTITVEERRLKVQKFLEKRKRRVYTKKISYLCRKRVADQRERYKGRFVSKKTDMSRPSENPAEV